MVSNGRTGAVLVTGANGLIGRAFLQELVAKSAPEIRAQVRSAVKARSEIGKSIEYADFAKVDWREADFTRITEPDLHGLTQNCRTVVHCAGLVHRPEKPYQEYEVANVRATQQLAEAAARNGCDTFVFLSTSAVYGPGPFNLAEENSALKGNTPYAVSKMTSENWLQQFKQIPRIIILRPSLVFGEGDRGNLLSLIKEVKNGRYRHIGDGSTGKSVIYSRDLANAISLCVERLPQGLHCLNVANPQPVSMKDLTEEMARALSLNVKIQSVPESMAKIGVKALNALLPGRVPVTEEQLDKLTTTTTCSVARLVGATGFTPRNTLASALKAEIDWAKEAQLL
jgi:nucleoside-diphosphate-sugar epimerase